MKPGIGHNSGQFGRGWRTYAWKRARAELKPARVPLEIVRRRVVRAKALGLSYPQYASVLLGSGRDIVGFLFTVGGLQLRLARALSAPPHVAAKLAVAPEADRLALSPPEEPAEAFRVELSDALGARIDGVVTAPTPEARLGRASRAVRAALAARGAPPDTIVLVGQGRDEALLADAAHLAKFISSEDYFPPARSE